MQIAKKIEDIKFLDSDTTDLNDCDYLVSELLVMQSAAGWYVGKVCRPVKEKNNHNWLEPYDRYSGYYPNQDGAEEALTEMVGEGWD